MSTVFTKSSGGSMKRPVCTKCGWSLMTNGKCSNSRCENYPNPPLGVELKDVQEVYPPLGLFNNRQWGKWKLNIPARCLEHKTNPSQLPYQVFLGDINNSSSMLDWIFQVSSKTWATYKDISDLISAFEDIFDPQDTLCSGALSGGEGKSIDAKSFLVDCFADKDIQ